MRKRFYLSILSVVAVLAILVLGLSKSARATELDSTMSSYAPPQPGVIQFLTEAEAGEPLNIVANYLDYNVDALGLSQADLDNARTDSYVTEQTNTTHVQMQQMYNGIEVYNGLLLTNVAGDGSIINLHNQFILDIANLANGATPTLSALDAVNFAANYLNLTPVDLAETSVEEGVEQATTLNNAGIARQPITARLQYMPANDVRVSLAWSVEIYEAQTDNWWQISVDANTGRIINEDNLVIHEDFIAQFEEAHNASPYGFAENYATDHSAGQANTSLFANTYIVYPWPAESPNHVLPLPPADSRTTVANPAGDASANGSPFGWHSDNTTNWTDTQGNNVDAQKSGLHEECGAALDCTPGIDLTIDPATQPNVDAGIANLFYWNNIYHDMWYNYGFDEASGNFQENNNGMGGSGSDRVIANAQAPGNCNANMGTPSDGSNPTMNMFNCDIATPSRDGDLDNGVVVHEYTHGTSNRLTGGGGNVSCLNNSEQMGEGWSDWYGLMMSIEPGDTGADPRGIGTWLLGTGPDGPGVRTYRYSTDMTENPHTYNDLGSVAVPHGVGSIWSAMLWEVTWQLIDNGVSQSGYDADFYNGTGGNNLAMQLITDGMKLQPCSPGFVDGRDAILQADMNLTGGANQCLIWEGFAKRGLGATADQGSSGSVSDGTTNFDMPTSCSFLDPMPTTQDICAGVDAVYVVGVGPAYTAPVNMSIVGNPAGTTANFSPNPVVTTPSTTTLTIGNTAGVAAGGYTMDITGVGTTNTFSMPVTLNVFGAIPTGPALTTPADGETGVLRQAPLVWAASAGAATYFVEVATDAAFTAIVDSATVAVTNYTTIPLGSLTTYYWRVTSSNACGTGAASATYSFTTEPIPPIILIDDDDNDPDVRAFFTDALDNLGESYDVWDTNNSDNEPSAAYLASYDVVIWFTGDEFGGAAGPDAAGEAALSTWIDNNNCLLMSSQDYFYDRSTTTFMTAYLGMASVNNDSGDYTSVDGQNVFASLGNVPLNYPFNDYSDIINPDGTALSAFLGNNSNNAAISKEAGYRATWWTSPFSAIASQTNRDSAMSTFLNWCGGNPGPTPTPTMMPPTATPSTPTATPTMMPPTATPTMMPPTPTTMPPTATPVPTETPAPTDVDMVSFGQTGQSATVFGLVFVFLIGLAGTLIWRKKD